MYLSYTDVGCKNSQGSLLKRTIQYINNVDNSSAQWKVSNVSWVLACVADYCPDLVELSVAGWSRITSEQLFDLMQALPKLQKIDLSLTVSYYFLLPTAAVT